MATGNGQRLSETTRIEAFSDGVFAIAITLLILEIKVPHASGEHLAAALLAQWPSYAAFLASFVTIGVMWLNHHRLFNLINRSDERMVVLNLILLLGVTWVPFPTALIAEHLGHVGEQSAALVYTVSFFFIALAFNILWRHATKSELFLNPEVDFEAVAALTKQYRFGPFSYAIAIALAFWSATAAMTACGLLALFFAIPPGVLTSRAKA